MIINTDKSFRPFMKNSLEYAIFIILCIIESIYLGHRCREVCDGSTGGPINSRRTRTHIRGT